MWPFGNDSGKPPVPTISYTHTVSKTARRLTIKIDRAGQVIVVSPRFVPKVFIDQFVAQHQDWIVQKQSAFKKLQKNPDTITIYGKEYQKKIAYLPDQKLGILIIGATVIFNSPEAALPAVPARISAEQKSAAQLSSPIAATPRKKTTASEHTWGNLQEKALERFLKSTAQVYILKRTEQLAKKMNVTYGNITLREQSSRWGSCSSAGNLNFNWRLVHAAPTIIDYVIVHELAHRVHMDHSKSFWNVVAKYDPEYQIHRGWLKREGHALS